MKTANQDTIFKPCSSVACVTAFGAKGDGVADDTAAIQAALDSGAGQVIIPVGLFVIRRSILPHEGQHLIIDGTIRVADAEIQPLAADVRVGDCRVQVRDASGYRVGETVTVHDDRLPIQGGGRKTRRQNAGNAQIVAIDGDTLELSEGSGLDYLCSANGVVARQHAAIWVRYSRVRLSGRGTIDCNQAGQLDTAPGVFSLRHSEDWRTASGIVVMGSERDRSDPGPGDKWIQDIRIEDVTVIDAVLHGICMGGVERGIIRNTTVLRSHDKNITLWCCRDCVIDDNVCCDSVWEDGIMLHQVADPAIASERIRITGNLCKNNARYGIHVGANIRRIQLANNLCVKNGLNFSIYGDECTSTGDTAIGTTDRLFTAPVYRPNVLFVGRALSIVNLSALGTRFAAVQISGRDITLTGGIVGEMETDIPPEPDAGLRVAEGAWGRGSGEFYVSGDCRIGLVFGPDFRGGREPTCPDGVRVTGIRIGGCRIPYRVLPGSSNINLAGLLLRNNDAGPETSAEAADEVKAFSDT